MPGQILQGRLAEWPLIILLFVGSMAFSGCNSSTPEQSSSSIKANPMPAPIVDFSPSETTLLRDLNLVVYRNKLILDAQPPITTSQLDKISQQVDGKLPPDLIALWQTSFGGTLDYDLDILFGDHLYPASFRELFYSGSNHYDTLDGWIDHEIEVLQEVSEEQGLPTPQKTPYVPFGGFEYLERFYVSVEPDEYGRILAYAQGIPWKGRLNEDSIATIATDVSNLFDQLSLNEDPFGDTGDDYANGKTMVERIREIEIEHPQLAKKLITLVRASVFDWQTVIDKTDFDKPLTVEQIRAVRLALIHAVTRKDPSLINRLREKGAPFDIPLHGTKNVLCYALASEEFAIAERLLEVDADVGNAPILSASNCPDELLKTLLHRGIYFETEAIYSAAETGSLDGALAILQSTQVTSAESLERTIKTALRRAEEHEKSATEIESGKLISYLTADQYRQQAEQLRRFAQRLKNDS